MASGDEQILLDELRPIALSITEDDRYPPPPPPGLWRSIEEEAFGAGQANAAGPDQDQDGLASVTPISHRRRWVASGLAVAAAVALLLGVLAVSDSGDTVVGTAELAAIEDRGAGSADLVDADGTLRLRIETSDVVADDGEYLELWLIDETVTGLVSLGPVGEDGLYDLPDGIDPGAFPIVDISTEAHDGDPTHGGRSIVRGQLELA